MTIKSARAFCQRITTDQAFQAQLLNAISDDQRREIILAAGYRFTPPEWEAALAEISASDNDDQLSDAELVAIVGGIGAVARAPASFSYRSRSSIWPSFKPFINGICRWSRWFDLPAWPIAAKLSAALLSVALVPMGFTTYYNLQESLENAEGSEYRKLELLATSNASRLDQLIVDIQRVVIQVGTERNVVGFLAATTPKEQQTFRPAMQRTLDNVYRSSPDYDAVYLLDKAGRCLASTDPVFMGQNYSFRKYFQRSIQGKPYVSGILVGETTKRPGLFFASPVKTGSGETVGVSVLKIRGEDIWAIVSELQVDSQSYAFLVDEHGVIISHPDKSLLYRSLAPLSLEAHKEFRTDRPYGLDPIASLNVPQLASAIVGAEETGHTSYYSPLEQTDQMVGFAPLKMEPWVLGVNKPKVAFAAPLNHLIWQNSRIMLIVGVLAAIIALLLARSIVRPIHALTQAAKALKQDEFEPRTLSEASRAQDDIGQLIRVFLQMAQALRAREQKLKQQVAELCIEIDQVKKARQVAEITGTEYFQQLQTKAQSFKSRAVTDGETEVEYFQQLQTKAQRFKSRAIPAND